MPRDASGALLTPTTLIRDAHRAGLVVHAWTFRNENTFLPLDFQIGTEPAAHGDAAGEYRLFYRLGLDGVFSDHPATALSARPTPRDPAPRPAHRPHHTPAPTPAPAPTPSRVDQGLVRAS